MNTFTFCTDQENNGNEEIGDVILKTESCSNYMSNESCSNYMINISYKNGSITAEISDDIEENDKCNDWIELFC